LRFADRGHGPRVPPLPAVARPRSRFHSQCRFSTDLPSSTHNQRPGHRQPGLWLALGRGCRFDRRRDSWLYRAAANSTRAASLEGQRDGHSGDRSRMVGNSRSSCPDCFGNSLLENARSPSAKTPRSTGASHYCLISIRRLSGYFSRFLGHPRVLSRGDLPRRRIRQQLAH
jgi:hypothetical protein